MGIDPTRASLPESTESLKQIDSTITTTPKRRLNRKLKTVFARLTGLMQIAVLNADVIKAFKQGTTAKGSSFKTDGKQFFLFDKLIARKTPGGIEVSNAGFPTATTFKTFRQLGVSVKTQQGVTRINGKVADPKSKAFQKIPNKDLAKGTIFATPASQRGPGRKRGGFQSTVNLQKLRAFREQSRLRTTGSKKALPLSETAIQPSDQKIVNTITGVKSPTGKKTVGGITHHILFKSKQPGLAFNPNNAINVSTQEHKEIHKLNPTSKRKVTLKGKLLKLAQGSIVKGPTDLGEKRELSKPKKKLKKIPIVARLQKLAGIKDILVNQTAGGADASKFKHKGLGRTPGKAADKRLKGIMDISAEAGPNPRQTFSDAFNMDAGEDRIADPHLKKQVAGRAVIRKQSRKGTSTAKLKERLAVLKPLILKRKKPKRIFKRKTKTSGMEKKAQAPIPSLAGKDIIARFKQTGVGDVQQGNGFTFLADENRVADVLKPNDAQHLRNKFRTPRNESLALVSRTLNIKEPDKLEAALDKIKIEGKEPLIGGFNYPDERGLEFDATFPMAAKNDDAIIKELVKTNQQSAVAVDPDLTVRFVRNPSFKNDPSVVLQ